MTNTPNLALPFIDANQSQKHVTHNEALRALDAIVQLAVVDDSLAAPPGSPADGDRYIVAASPTGAWAGQAGKIAAYLAGAWAFLTPKTGWRAWVASRSVAVLWSGSAWINEPSLAGFRNRLRNASFAINQRVVSGTVTLAAGAYGHDGVKAGASGATYTLSASGLDTTLTISAGSLILPIEDVLIEGGTYVLSHAGTAQVRIWQTSASGSYAAVPAGGLAATGLTANTLTGVEFSTGTVLRPQFEPGSVPTAFERRPLNLERWLCFRYFRRYQGSVSVPMCGVSVSGSSMIGVIDLGVDMRATPTTSASFTDSDFSSGVAPNSSQWAVGVAGSSWSTKSGTATIGVYTSPSRIIIRTTGATYSPVPNIFTMGGNHYIEVSAEL